MKDQMELFEDGGLKDEGGTVDEVSGNEVPIGGTKKGVRDDVPAMVSEGEFVFPEDVTRYIGLDKLMQLRQEAKMGLKRMEAMGQMGNGDEATIPDDMPFGMADLVIVAGDTGEELEMQEGGFVTRPTTATRTQPQPTYTPPPQQPTTTQPTTTRRLTPEIQRPERTPIDFKKLMGEASISYVEYRNAAGANMMIPHVGGVPVFPIPEGYTKYEGPDVDENAGETEIVNEVQEKTVAFNEANKNNSDPIIKNAFVEAGSWDSSPIDMYLKEALKFVNGTSATVNGLVSAVSGGVLSPLVYGFSALEKRRILATIDDRIKNNPEQAADLFKIKKALEEGKPLQSAIGFVANAVKDIGQKIFGLEEEQAEAAATNTIQIEIEQVAPSYATMDMGEAGRTSRPIQEQVVSTQPAETAPVSSFIATDPRVSQTPVGAITGQSPEEIVMQQPVTYTGPSPEEIVMQQPIPVPVGPTGGYDEQPIVQGAEILGQLEAPIVYGQPSPTAAKVEITPYKGSAQEAAGLNAIEQMRRMTEERATDRKQVIDPEFTKGIPEPDFDPRGRDQIPTVEQKQSSLMPVPAPVGPTGSYDEAGLSIDPRKPITTTGGLQATIFQEKQAAESEARRKKELQEAKDFAEAQEKLRLQEQQDFIVSLQEQQETSATELEAAKEAADLKFNEEINKIRQEQADEIETLVAQGVDRALAEATAAKKAKDKEDTAKETKQYTETLAETGTATRTGTAAPATSIKPKAKPATISTATTSSADDDDVGYMVEGAGYTTINGIMPTSEQQKEQRIAAANAKAAGKDPQAAVNKVVEKQKDDKPTTTTSSTDKNKNIASSGRSETQIQSDINSALDASGGEWTSELNDLVSERDSARANEGTSTTTSSGGGDGGGGSDDSDDGTHCCTASQKRGDMSLTEVKKLRAWHRQQSIYWQEGYDIWGKVIADHLVAKSKWQSDRVRDFYNHKIYGKITIGSVYADIVIYPMSYVIGVYKVLSSKVKSVKKIKEV